MNKNTYGGRVVKSEWGRYRNGLWLPNRKRTYLYWFKYLQHAETAPNTKFEVDWSKYRGWGGANEVLGRKFDAWWEDRWEDLFGYKDKSPPLNKQRFPLSSTRFKYDAVRLALLVYEYRETDTDWTPRGYGGKDLHKSQRRKGNALAIARRVISHEKGKKRQTYTGMLDENEVAGEQVVQSSVGRYMRQAKKILGNVCDGKFP